MKLKTRIQLLKTVRNLSVIAALAGFLCMIGTVGAMDAAVSDFGRLMIQLCLSLGVFIMAAIVAKHCDDELDLAVRQLIQRRRTAGQSSRPQSGVLTVRQRHNIA